MSDIGLFPDGWEGLFNIPSEESGNSHYHEDFYIATWKACQGTTSDQWWKSRPSNGCDHDYRVRRKDLSDGRRAYVKQCISCYSMTAAISEKNAREMAADEGLLDANAIPVAIKLDETYINDAMRKWVDGLKAQEAGNELKKWRIRHNEYLRSATWKAKRAAVMTRCGGICEGCRQRPAAEVHHLNYKGWPGNELLYNLVALCRECHAEAERQEGRNHE